jgi:hypothetical protein
MVNPEETRFPGGYTALQRGLAWLPAANFVLLALHNFRPVAARKERKFPGQSECRDQNRGLAGYVLLFGDMCRADGSKCGLSRAGQLYRSEGVTKTGIVTDVESAELLDSVPNHCSDPPSAATSVFLKHGATDILFALPYRFASLAQVTNSTTAPTPTQRTALARPIPLPAPVIVATSPSSLPIIVRDANLLSG